MNDVESERRDLGPPEAEIGDRGKGSLALTDAKDIALLRRAFTENWPMTADDKDRIVRELMKAFEETTSKRDRMNIAKVLLLADAQNVKRAGLIVAASKAESAAKPSVHFHGPAAVQLYLPDNGRRLPDVTDRVPVIEAEKTTADS